MHHKYKMACLALGVALTLTGCVTTDPTAASNFAVGVGAAKTQVDTAFASAALTTRTGEIGYVATQPSLKEADFIQTPTADTIGAWDQALASVQKYAQDLSALVAPGVTANFDSAATNLAASFDQAGANLLGHSLGSPGTDAILSTAFTEAANALLKAKANATARKVAAQTDAEISAIFTLLAAEIGSSQTNGLRGTVYASWEAQLSTFAQPFAAAAGDTAKKTQIAQQYADMLNKRDAQDQSLAALNSALLALKSAHHALAVGDPVTLRSAVSLVVSDSEQTAALFNQFKTISK